jgi:GNAT superfamily N-acetyltransferase
MNILRIEETPGYIETVAKWLYEEWGQHLPNSSISRAEKELRRTSDATGLPVSFLAIVDDEPVGVARLVINDMESKPDISPWLASVYVTPQYRDRRIGSELCYQVIKEAYRLNFLNVYLFTPDRERFYARQGWVVIERSLYQGKNIVIMKKNLVEHQFAADHF